MAFFSATAKVQDAFFNRKTERRKFLSGGGLGGV
jgi:hypothetical protein